MSRMVMYILFYYLCVRYCLRNTENKHKYSSYNYALLQIRTAWLRGRTSAELSQKANPVCEPVVVGFVPAEIPDDHAPRTISILLRTVDNVSRATCETLG